MDQAAPSGGSVGTVADQFFTMRDFRLQSGTVMPEIRIAYETYGTLAADGRNAVLVAHGYTGGHHAAGCNPANRNQPGWWDTLIGPGKPFDTSRLFVVASNMLGSSYGSTNAASTDPATGRRYGADFPAITVRDIVEAEKRLVDALGITHLVAVAGPSYGGFQSFQWAVAFPDMMDGVVPVNTAPRSGNSERQLAELLAQLGADPDWNGGNYYGHGGELKGLLTEMRVATLKRYGIEAQLVDKYPDKTAREAAIRETAAGWAREWDANSLVILRKALAGFDTTRDFARIKAKMLYVLTRTDVLFPPSIAPEVMQALAAAGVDARYVEIDSELGHTASGPEHAKWSPALREFLAPLIARVA